MNEDKITSQNHNDIGYKTLFSGDTYLMLVHKKSHGISRAIYLITDFFDDKEPIKVRMRQEACDLVELVLSLSTELSPERKSLLDNLIKTCLSLISYSEIAMFSGIESQMNHRVLSAEIKSLVSIIEDREMPSRLGRHFVLDEAFFPSLSNPKNKDSFAENKVSTALKESPDTKSENTNLARRKEQHTSEAQDIKKEQRRASILSVIKTKGNPSTKDIADVITDCSEKTIQRELLDMVAKGLLKKEGERRWSRYSLVS